MKRYQQGKLMIRRDVSRPYYYIWITVYEITTKGREPKRERNVIGFVDQMSKKRAMELRAQILEVVNEGHTMVRAQIKMGDLIDRFIATRMPTFEASTAYKYASQIRTHLRPFFGNMQLFEVNRQVIEEWLAVKKTEGQGYGSREGLRGLLSSIFTAAKEWKWWDEENPVHGVRIGRKEFKREKRLVTDEQARMILAGVCDRTRLMIMTALLLGLRISEVCGLKWEDFDFVADTVSIKRRWDCRTKTLAETKSEAGTRKLELGPLATNFKMFRKQTIGFVFHNDGVPVDTRTIQWMEFRPLLQNLGIYYQGFGFHSFRRTHITLRQTAGGATPLEAMKAAGHARVDMTLAYTLNSSERDKAQVQAIFDQIIGTTEGMKQ